MGQNKKQLSGFGTALKITVIQWFITSKFQISHFLFLAGQIYTILLEFVEDYVGG
jgi:hypothetical protein